jgi:hypothetical protein
MEINSLWQLICLGLRPPPLPECPARARPGVGNGQLDRIRAAPARRFAHKPSIPAAPEFERQKATAPQSDVAFL